jgi:hypothetical protein
MDETIYNKKKKNTKYYYAEHENSTKDKRYFKATIEHWEHA